MVLHLWGRELFGISRQLFYYYCKDKYDLVNTTYKHDVDEIVESYSLDSSWKNIAFHILCYLKSNQVFYTKAFTYRGQNSFYDFFNQYSYDLIKKMMDHKKLSEQYDKASMKSLQFYANACVMTTQQWALGDMDLDPDEIADMISDNIPNSLTLFSNGNSMQA